MDENEPLGMDLETGELVGEDVGEVKYEGERFDTPGNPVPMPIFKEKKDKK